MLATFLLQYDVKMSDGVRPADVKIGPSIAPCRIAKVLLKRRDFCNPTESTEVSPVVTHHLSARAGTVVA